jgi:hypothetical protein
MKNMKLLLVGLIAVAMIPWISVEPTNAAQGQSTALERGYRTGYSDGYTAGYRDLGDKARRDYKSKADYQQADRAYNEVWGPIEDYQDGYQQGYEAGYNAGYEGQAFNSTIPAGLKRRPLPAARTNNPIPNDQTSQTQDTPVSGNTTGNSTGTSTVNTTPNTYPDNSLSIARDAVMLVELLSSLSTDATQRGDRFQARVLDPREYEGAIVEGRVTAVKRPGRVKGVAELQLTFDTIRLPDNRTGNFNADVIEVLQMSGGDGVSNVDPEGGVRGKDSTKDDVSKVGAATGIGAIIGAIAGGGKGAAIGAAIGAGVGGGAVLTQRGKDIRLERGQQMKIRTATETRVESRN